MENESVGQATTEQQNKFAVRGIADEFASWPASDVQVEAITEVKWAFDDLLGKVKNRIAPQNGRYIALVATKLEEACMMAVKGITKP